jgi:hypothetical protein
MIKRIVKTVIPTVALERLQRIKKQVRNLRSLAYDYGQWTTIRDWNSIDENGDPIPWYTYPTTEYIAHLNLSWMTIFEYGSGNSTLWWAKRSKSVVSVEDDEEWFEKVRQNLSSGRTQYHLKTRKEDYVTAALNDADIFIIDGKYRKECAEHIVKIGGAGVMIILDNSDWHPEIVEFLRSSLGWLQIDFHGFGPINNYTWTTSVFINPKRHQELVYGSNLKSKCGLVKR